MSAKHTPTPLIRLEHLPFAIVEVAPDYAERENLVTVYAHSKDAIVRAVNAYERDQETIKTLSEALKGLISVGQFAHGVLAETKFDKRKAGEATEVEELRVALIRAGEALAKATEPRP